MKESGGSVAAEFFVFVFCLLGLFFNMLVITSCQVLELDGDVQDGGFGLFQFQEPLMVNATGADVSSSTCLSISDIGTLEGIYTGFFWAPNDDKVLRFAQVGSALAFAIGLILLLNLATRQCFRALTKYQLIMYVCGTAVQVCLGWVYLIWWSNGCDFYFCTFGTGSTYLILTQLFWLMACVLTKFMRPSLDERHAVAAASAVRFADGDEDAAPMEKFWNKKTLLEYLPVIVTLLIIALLLYFALRNVSEQKINN